MSEEMTTISFEKMLQNLIKEYKETKSFFGVPVSQNQMDVPIGLAAGPHTQLAGNIVAGYAAGANIFELKTVQVLQGKALGISKPCIDVGYEVYNTEWSTELKISEARDEYIKAYLLISVLSKMFQLKTMDKIQFIASVGYDLKGIQSEIIDDFLMSMKHAKETEEWKKDIAYIKQYCQENSKAGYKNVEAGQADTTNQTRIETNQQVPRAQEESLLSPEDIAQIEANDVIADTVTLSTMHGCPRSEIQEIATYLMKEKGMNTFIKLNPTLLGEERIAEILRTKGYEDIEVAHAIFDVDMTKDMALELIHQLKQIAVDAHKVFGIKLTNTLPVKNKREHLKGETMYLSGMPLYPIAIEVAYEIAKRLEDDIPISYSGGIHLENVKQVLGAGIAPITVSSLILKPGGYKNLTKLMERTKEAKPQKLDVAALKALVDEARENKVYDYQTVRTFKLRADYTSYCGKCNNCVDVCPNRANVAGSINGKKYVIHLDSLCNECGACKCQCIMGHEPYKEKLTVYTDKKSLEAGKDDSVFYNGETLLVKEGCTLKVPEKQLIELIQCRL